MNQGVHTVDLLIATMGRPVEVFAYTGTLAHQRIETEDAAVAVVRFESGALGVLPATTAAYPGLSARLQVHGDRGSIVIHDDALTFIHVTRAGAEAEGKLMGYKSRSLNQVEKFALSDAAGPTAGGATRVRCPPSRTAASTRTSWPRWLGPSACALILRPTGRRSVSSPVRTSQLAPGSRCSCDDPSDSHSALEHLLAKIDLAVHRNPPRTSP